MFSPRIVFAKFNRHSRHAHNVHGGTRTIDRDRVRRTGVVAVHGPNV